MLGRLVLLFITVPLIDLFVLLRVGERIGFWPTVGLVILTGAIGATLARHQGLRTLSRINAELSGGRMPTTELADGALILLAGAVLITPGFLTDLFGLSLLLPPVRNLLKHGLSRYFRSRIVIHAQHDSPFGPAWSPNEDAPGVEPDAPASRPMKYVENEAQQRRDA